LFTDVEGSTHLWAEHPETMRNAMARHDEIVRSAVESRGGYVVKVTGEGFHAVFATAHDAVDAAIDAQRFLGAESWDAMSPFRVRMGVHTCEAELRDGDYFGSEVNRAARLMAVAHGGQVVVSVATSALVRDRDIDLVDLGEHRLRDLATVERVFQVCAPGLQAEFPPLQSLDMLPGNLPLQLTSFVGRDDELVALPKMLGASRLVTLTGVGGVGKTRLALQVAAELLPRFAAGVWFCELATASDEVLMFHAVADAVGARQRDGMSMADSIVEYLREREALVVLDNCEHLLADAAWLASNLLQRCPKVRVLATSREGLGVAGEQLVALSSLSVPDVSADADAITASEAIWLFVDRAVAVRAGFTLGPANLAAVAEICRRLDGMPLAIELAAARVTAMSPTEIATKLDERFRLLTGGKRSRVERHQTLRAAVEWSYSLLDAKERSVFDRLGVFVGSFDAAAAEAVVTDAEVEGWDALECLGSLVEKSMVLVEDTDEGTTRYRLLETLRAFAREQLDAAGETDHWRRRHAEHYATFCERVGPELESANELAWARRVEAELDNIRAVLRWGSDATAQADADLALRIVIALTVLESFTTTWSTQPWADALIPRARSSSIAGRSGVIAAAAFSRLLQDDLEGAERLAREVLESPTGPRATRFIAMSYQVLGSARYRQGWPADALELVAEGHRALDAADAPSSDHCPLHDLGSLFRLSVGDRDGARREADEYVEIARATGKPSRISIALGAQGRAWFSEDPDRALAAFEESIALARGGGANTGMALAGAAQLRARAGDRFGALSQLRDAIATCHDRGSRVNLGLAIERAVAILANLREDSLAATCAGIVQAHVVTPYRTLPEIDRTAVRVAERLGPDAYQAAYTRGATLAFEKVAPTLLAALDDLLATADAPTPTGHA
jgi:predicted ATPase